ncbi:hypothetical protein Forpi1262_v014531 [Fusarium oxysporum f. sp. raphani]|uniref:Uncharacterized protein n=1 Tax=Fusarium oxysporum f. sp. raphani TaxID=96318 RepID=A0A8J5PQA2_FUSOX|nr:hypothetical protein Forpi1262_v014531 [Fusarium oxysporum f. sp. raphani]
MGAYIGLKFSPGAALSAIRLRQRARSDWPHNLRMATGPFRTLSPPSHRNLAKMSRSAFTRRHRPQLPKAISDITITRKEARLPSPQR